MNIVKYFIINIIMLELFQGTSMEPTFIFIDGSYFVFIDIML